MVIVVSHCGGLNKNDPYITRIFECVENGIRRYSLVGESVTLVWPLGFQMPMPDPVTLSLSS